MVKEEVWQVLDESIEIELSGGKYKAHMLPIKSIFSWAEGKAVSTALKNIHAVATALEGREKIEYLAEATKTAVPTGKELIEQAKGILYSVEAVEELLIQALKKEHPDIKREEIKLLVLENVGQLDSIIQLLIQGAGPKKEKE